VSLAWLAHAKGVTGQKTEARALIEQLEHLRARRYVPSYHLALAYAGVADKAAVFAGLSRARDERDPAIIHVAVEPRFAPLRTDPRFLALQSELRFQG
jgi:hypothetical protein